MIPNLNKFLFVCLSVYSWYRPPNSLVELLKDFENFLRAVDLEEKETLLAGDIDCDLSMNSNDSNTSVKFLYDAYQFSQFISDYT